MTRKKFQSYSITMERSIKSKTLWEHSIRMTNLKTSSYATQIARTSISLAIREAEKSTQLDIY
jgi:hypothetical protein